MTLPVRTLLTCTAFASAIACSHLTRLPVAEVPIDQFEATAVSAPPAPTTTALVVEGEATPPAVSATAAGGPAVAASAGSRPSSAAAGSGAPPMDISETPEQKLLICADLMKSGKKADLQQARKILIADVGRPNGTPAEAKMLRGICLRLNDKACVAKATLYSK